MLDTDSHDVKSAMRQLADTLPDGATWDDVMYRVYVHQAVDAGLRDAAEGRLKSAVSSDWWRNGKPLSV